VPQPGSGKQFAQSVEDAPVVIRPAVTTLVIAVTAAAALLLGIVPQPLLDLADKAAVFVR
jgi:NADH-quinone oxidoreductase subunit N